MRRLVPALAAAVLAASAVSFQAQAEPAGPGNSQVENRQLQQFCYDLIAGGEFPDLVLGECMSFNNTSDAGFKAHLCDMLRGTGQLNDWGFSSYSDCVRNIEL